MHLINYLTLSIWELKGRMHFSKFLLERLRPFFYGNVVLDDPCLISL